MNPKLYDKIILTLTLPSLYFPLWLGSMFLSLNFFSNSSGTRIYDLLGRPLDLIVLLSFAASAVALYLYGDSTRSRFMSACFIWNGLYMLFWIVGIAVFYFFLNEQNPFQKG